LENEKNGMDRNGLQINRFAGSNGFLLCCGLLGMPNFLEQKGLMMDKTCENCVYNDAHSTLCDLCDDGSNNRFRADAHVLEAEVASNQTLIGELVKGLEDFVCDIEREIAKKGCFANQTSINDAKALIAKANNK
jgi:hypothetical protein